MSPRGSFDVDFFFGGLTCFLMGSTLDDRDDARNFLVEDFDDSAFSELVVFLTLFLVTLSSL